MVGLDTYTWGIKEFHKCWSGSLAKRRLCLGPAGVINCTPLSAPSSEGVCSPESVAITPGLGYRSLVQLGSSVLLQSSPSELSASLLGLSPQFCPPNKA